MAKKKQKKVEVEVPQVEETVIMEKPMVEEPKRKDPVHKKLQDGWEIKDRVYYIKGNKKPLSQMIRSANIYWFDE